MLTFSEFAQGISPYCSSGMSEPVFFIELVGNYIKDAAMDACKILKRKDDTKYRYITGDRPIPAKEAQYLYKHRDTDKFSDWIYQRMDESDSYDAVCSWLKTQGIDFSDPSDACAELLTSIFLAVCIPCTAQVDAPNRDDYQLIEEIEEKIKLLPRPKNVPVPKEATHDEKRYIEELYCAYGDAEGIDSFSANDLAAFPYYEEDIEERRIDFYAAVTIQRGVMELGTGQLSNQFDVLKSETLTGVRDTARRKHENGYECMLSVMEQAVSLPVTNYILSSSPYWISGKIKKGVCHHLVNDGELVWVKKKHG